MWLVAQQCVPSPFSAFAQISSLNFVVAPCLRCASWHSAAEHGCSGATATNFLSSVQVQVTSTPRSTSSARRLFLTARLYAGELADSAAPTAVIDSKTPNSLASSTRPLVTEILTSVLGIFTPSQLQRVLHSREGRQLEGLLLESNADGERAANQLRDLLRAVVGVVGDGISNPSAKVVAGCPALLLWEPRKLLERVHELQAEDGVCDKQVSQLLVEFPSFLTLPSEARETIGQLLGKVGLTGKEVARLTKRRPQVLETSNVRQLVVMFMGDLQIGKTDLQRIICSQPGLLSLTLTRDVQKKMEFFTKEMGLESDQVAKMVRTHPQVLTLSLDKNIRRIVKWLGSPNPAAREEILPSAAAVAGLEEHENDVTDSFAEDEGLDGFGLAPKPAGVTPIDMPSYIDGEWEWGLGLDPEGRRQVVSKQGDVLWKSVPGNLAKSTAWFVEEVGLSWDAMQKLVARSPALLCLSVDNNLRPTMRFLLEELGMDRTTLKQTIVNQPTLLTLSVPGNLRPKVALFRDELGIPESDIADLLNQCPRVMNASVTGRILPRFQAMRNAGVSPSFSHLRAICNYPESRFAGWFERQTKSCPQSAVYSSATCESSPTWITTAKTCDPDGGDSDSAEHFEASSQTKRNNLATNQTRLRGSGKLGQPSFRADSLSELGISYAVRSLLPSGGRAPSAAMGPLGTDSISSTTSRVGSAVAGEEAFASGRIEGRALVRRVARGLEVLDLYCGTGGFALNAAIGGARSSLGVDKSARAVRASAQNALANSLADTASFVRVEALSFARQAESEGRAWDLVVIDPPSFSRKSAARALDAYTRMAGAVSRLVRPGGMLMVVNGSGGDVFETHEDMVEGFSQAAARAAGLSLTLLDAGGTIHPTSGLKRPSTGDARGRVASGDVDPKARSSVEDELGRESEGEVEVPSVRWALFVCSKAPSDSVTSHHRA